VIELLRIAASVSSALSLLGLVAGFIFWLAHKRQAASIKEAALGEDINNPGAVVEVLKTFHDDKHRLEALASLLKGDRQKAATILSKVKENINLERFVRRDQAHTTRILVIAAIGFLILALLGLYAAKEVEARQRAVQRDVERASLPLQSMSFKCALIMPLDHSLLRDWVGRVKAYAAAPKGPWLDYGEGPALCFDHVDKVNMNGAKDRDGKYVVQSLSIGVVSKLFPHRESDGPLILDAIEDRELRIGFLRTGPPKTDGEHQLNYDLEYLVHAGGARADTRLSIDLVNNDVMIDMQFPTISLIKSGRRISSVLDFEGGVACHRGIVRNTHPLSRNLHQW
jgi:hypothetical protein